MTKLLACKFNRYGVLAVLLILVLVGCNKQGERAPEEAKVKITSLEPERGGRGDTVIITGTGFSNDVNDLAVNFGPTRATIKTAGEKVIVAEVPPSIVDGTYELTVTNNRLKFTSPPATFVVSGLAKATEVSRPPSTEPATSGRPPARETATVPEHSGTSIVVPSGTNIVVRSIDAISTKTNRAGNQVEMSLDEPLVTKGQLVAPKGSRVVARITNSKEPGRVKGRAQLSLRLVELTPTGGSPHRITSSVFSSEAPGSKKRDAIIIGTMAGVGTAIGAIAGGGKGAAIGAAAGGAGGVGTVMVVKGKQLEIPPETRFRFRLVEPVTLPSRGAARDRTGELR